MILSPIGKLYGRLMDARNALFERGTFQSHRLGARTISVGNLTTGGTGKSPLVALVSEMLLEAGENVCILTRGYGRARPRERVLVSDGVSVLADAREGGDEPAELAHRLQGRAVVIADADRLAAGRWAKERFGITTFVLDDGFQHRRVKRDIDIVCVDATNPCGNGRILPAGTLRESFKGLGRADAVVLTRTDLVEDASAIEERLRRRNGGIPIYRAETRIVRLTPLEEFLKGSRTVSRNSKTLQAGAFCGVGNPNAFFLTLQRHLHGESGDESRLVLERPYPDHHSYKTEDVKEIELLAKEAGAEVLITTAKDAVKLRDLQFSLPCLVAESEIEIREGAAFRQLVIDR